MLNVYAQLLVNGIIAGALYSLVASGFSLIYSTNKFVHFAHGGVIALSAYGFWILTIKGYGLPISVLCTIVFSSALGYFLNKLVYKPLRLKRSRPSLLLIASIALLIMLESLSLLLFGANTKILDTRLSSTLRSIEIAGITITPVQIMIIVFSAFLLFVLCAVMVRTRTGKALRAVANNKEVAEIMGISCEAVYARAFLIGSAIAGIAAIFISFEQNISPTMGTGLMIKGFTAAVIGGVDSLPGAILGAFVLGLSENLGGWFLPFGYKDAIAFLFLFIFLLFRPQGILGNQKIRS